MKNLIISALLTLPQLPITIVSYFEQSVYAFNQIEELTLNKISNIIKLY